jgi:hypothetical protein
MTNREKLQKLMDSIGNNDVIPAINAIRELTGNLPDSQFVESHLETIAKFVVEINEFCDTVHDFLGENQ